MRSVSAFLLRRLPSPFAVRFCPGLAHGQAIEVQKKKEEDAQVRESYYEKGKARAREGGAVSKPGHSHTVLHGRRADMRTLTRMCGNYPQARAHTQRHSYTDTWAHRLKRI